MTDGAGVSAPSENLGFYFSGMRAPDWGPVNTYDNPTVIANTLITVDMSLMKPQWSNDTLPSNISGRVNGELVWLPVSNSGVLLAIGGVYNATVLSADSTIPSNVSYIVCEYLLFPFGTTLTFRRMTLVQPTWSQSLSMMSEVKTGRIHRPELDFLSTVLTGTEGTCKTPLATRHLN